MEDSILAQAKHDAVLIGEHFSAWRRLNGLKLVDLAERSGVSVNTIRDLENGKGGTGLIAVLAIARVLGVDNLRPDDPDEPPHYKSERMLLLENHRARNRRTRLRNQGPRNRNSRSQHQSS